MQAVRWHLSRCSGLEGAILNSGKSILLMCVYALRTNFLSRRKLKMYKKIIIKIVGILRKMSELLVKSDV
jgi:hypothetical protein